MKTISVITTGGDAPGMNAAIRSVVRSSLHFGFRVIGFRRGWWGLIERDYLPLGRSSVSNILYRGGTILHTVRCPSFKDISIRRKAARHLKELSPDGLIVIGGDGSMTAAYHLSRISKTPMIGIPASIDNDIAGTDETIGFDTAINTALDATDKIRDTAASHNRIFIVEVMGRKRGFLALSVGITSGAEVILIPEIKWEKDGVIKDLGKTIRTGKNSILIVMAEGAGDPFSLARHIEKNLGRPVRVSNLGYIQRGGSPTVDSRLLASVFGYEAVKSLKKGAGGIMLTWVRDRIGNVPLSYPFKNTKKIDRNLIRLAGILSG
ncbi:MAG: 6-phosphofructokinase [Elusimicrobia bacterium]|nr:6-phosphofructokinase [Elusimicrobiota bacterium]